MLYICGPVLRGYQSPLWVEMGSFSLPRCHKPGRKGIEEAGHLPTQLHRRLWGGRLISEAKSHFSQLQGLLETLGLQEACHKVSPPSKVMVWLGFQFDILAMTVTLPSETLGEIMSLVGCWSQKSMANIHDLRSLLGKFLCVVLYCSPTHLFTNRMLETLRACPLQGVVHLSPEFREDLAWFQQYLPHTNGVFLIHEESRTPILLFVDLCTSG